MFGNGKKLEEIIDNQETFAEVLVEMNKRLLELKVLILANKAEIMKNNVAIKKEKQPVKIIEKEVVVKRARKKPRPRLRTTGGKKVTQEEIDEFIRLFDQGLSFTEISGTTGRSASVISKYVYEAKKGLEEK